MTLTHLGLARLRTDLELNTQRQVQLETSNTARLEPECP